MTECTNEQGAKINAGWQEAGPPDPLSGSETTFFSTEGWELSEDAQHIADANTRADELRRVRAERAALLAVVKEADSRPERDDCDDLLGRIAEALNALDAAHPDWREWTP